MEIANMTDEQRKAVAFEYLKRLDRGEGVFDLFDDNAEVYFPKWGIASGRLQFEKLFMDLGLVVAKFKHDMAYLNVIQQGDLVVVEGTSYGKTQSGVDWRAGVTHAGRWCDVFEIRNFKIQRCFIYLDPDYEGSDTARYPWLNGKQ
ncbi:nuclear transport factor 2 family protein [Undibacterium arcticum]|uniref:Nuclear transport factor 2 family protein n=1 Tax=Undibacterium arcticum TaxID=1762892 RepID=A0ABV7F864_9BURK